MRKTIYVFGSHPGDARAPASGLTELGGVLYGTTPLGNDGNTYGAVFSVTPSGAEKVIYDFPNATSFVNPGLAAIGETLYGTIESEHGTVFSLTPTGVMATVYTFKGGTDGDGLLTGLAAYNGVLYGTTENGGTYGKGTLFSLTPDGKKTTLHSFSGGLDGSYPMSTPTVVPSGIFGVTGSGSDAKCSCGSVFFQYFNGPLAVVHSFTGGADGSYPMGPLLIRGEQIIGATLTGTIYAIAP